MKGKIDQTLEKISHIISSHLLKNGAMSNGYEVSVEGRIDPGFYGHVKVLIGSIDSHRKLRDIGDDIIGDIKSHIPKGWTLVINTKHLEHGCNEIRVSLERSQLVRLW